MNTENNNQKYNDKEIKAGLEKDDMLKVLNNSVQVAWAGTKPTGFSTTLKGKTKEVVKDTKAKKGRVRASATVLETRNNILGKMLSIYQQACKYYKEGTHPSDVRGVRIVSTDRVAEIQAKVDEMARQLDDLRVEALREWDTIRAESIEGLGDNIHEVNVPHNGEEFLSEFKIAVSWTSTPMAIKKGTIFDGMTEEIANKVIAQSEKTRIDVMARNHAKVIKPAMDELKKAIKAVLGGDRLHQKTFDKLKAAAVELKELNWFEFDVINDIVRDLEEVGSIQRDHLGKAGSATRKLAATAIEDVYNQAERTASRLAVCGL